jgi:multicomponent Na+:H+ antiporter subunit A
VHGRGASLELGYHLDLRPTAVAALAGWALGAGLAAARRRLAPLLAALGAAARFGPARLWDSGLRRIEAIADRLSRIERHDLRDRMASMLVPGALLLVVALVAGFHSDRYVFGSSPLATLPLAIAAVAAAAASLATLFVPSHLGIVLLLTSVGFSLSIVFALLGAPDVALVAVLVETALTLLFTLALARLPEERIDREPRHGLVRHRARWHTAAALLGGTVVFVAAWLGLSNPAPTTVATRHVELADQAHTANVVTAILADFRGLDTLGEVAVLVVALLGIRVLLGGRRA